MQHTQQTQGMEMQGSRQNYLRLLLMALLSFVVMYFAMFAMIHTASNLMLNLNTGYMALLMAAPMVLLSLAIMRSMYGDRLLTLAVATACVLLIGASFIAIRQQAAIRDEQFLRSMIPHHSGAILMCRQSSVSDPEIVELCRSIVESQQSEIDQMQRILTRMDD